MLHASPSLSLAKFLWAKPQPLQSSPMTVSANGEANPAPMKLNAYDNSLEIDSSKNSVNGISRSADVNISSEEESNTLAIVGLKEFWNHHMKLSEGKFKQYYEQISSRYQHRGAGYDIETGEVDWGALMEKVAWRWRLSQEKPDDMNIEDWQKLQEMSAHLRPWFIYKTYGLYSRIICDPESRSIFQEFDFC